MFITEGHTLYLKRLSQCSPPWIVQENHGMQLLFLDLPGVKLFVAVAQLSLQTAVAMAGSVAVVAQQHLASIARETELGTGAAISSAIANVKNAGLSAEVATASIASRSREAALVADAGPRGLDATSKDSELSGVVASEYLKGTAEDC